MATKAAAPKIKRPGGSKSTRTAPRVEDSERTAGANTKPAVHRGATVQPGIPIGSNGLPMIEIVSQASEVIPVAQYANVTAGPIAIRRWIEDPGVHVLADVNWDGEMTKEQQNVYDQIRGEMAAGQQIVEDVIAEDRENILESVRRQNEAQSGK